MSPENRSSMLPFMRSLISATLVLLLCSTLSVLLAFSLFAVTELEGFNSHLNMEQMNKVGILTFHRCSNRQSVVC